MFLKGNFYSAAFYASTRLRPELHSCLGLFRQVPYYHWAKYVDKIHAKEPVSGSKYRLVIIIV